MIDLPFEIHHYGRQILRKDNAKQGEVKADSSDLNKFLDQADRITF